jgi:uncharacterized protein YjiS (DUF1127 family)
MLTKFLLALVNLIRRWILRRAERQAMWMATDGLSRSPDQMLDDIGISRDDITCAFHGGRSPSPR